MNNVLQIPKYRYHHLQVLIVDDDTFMLDVMKMTLRRLGLTKITTAENGHDALQLLDISEEQFDVVLCDLQMPVMDGVEFLRHLVRIKFGGSVVLTSGEGLKILNTVERLAQAHHLNVLGSISKPFGEDEFEEVLSNIEKETIGVQELNTDTIGKKELLAGIQNNQMLLHYQPKVYTKTRKIAGVEALVRWKHPEKGLIPPNKFISIAEKYNIIDELTFKVIELAFQQARTWKAQNNNIKISVNISMDNLNRIDFPDLIANLAGKYHVNTIDFILELTESGITKDVCTSLDIISRLRLKGFSLSIDDFGTGYSSMEKLKELPFTELKIDRKFVHGASKDKDARSILEANILLAKKLNMDVVAEGVEYEADWNLVESLGCDMVQGYYISRPTVADNLFRSRDCEAEK